MITGLFRRARGRARHRAVFARFAGCLSALLAPAPRRERRP
ncbi:hypothetical protein [Polymorphum gilvum]|nr:hypothetical protein [Polymorphum gilvum]